MLAMIGPASLEPSAQAHSPKTSINDTKPLRLTVLRALLWVIRYAEDGKNTPIALAAEGVVVSYKVKTILRKADGLYRKRGAKFIWEENAE